MGYWTDVNTAYRSVISGVGTTPTVPAMASPIERVMAKPGTAKAREEGLSVITLNNSGGWIHRRTILFS